MQEVEYQKQAPQATQEQLPTTAWMQEVEYQK
jgi:hypothetical protein